MPRDRRSTSFTASCSVLYGHMRRPPSAGPSTVLWIAMMAFRPASLLWQKTTSSWPVLAMVSKIIGTWTPHRTVLGKALIWESVSPAKDLTPETQNPSERLGWASYPDKFSTSREHNAFASQQTEKRKRPAYTGRFDI